MSDVSNRFGECHTTSELKDQMRGTNVNLLCPQHFTGTLDNWDPSVSDPGPTLYKRPHLWT